MVSCTLLNFRSFHGDSGSLGRTDSFLTDTIRFSPGFHADCSSLAIFCGCFHVRTNKGITLYTWFLSYISLVSPLYKVQASNKAPYKHLGD